MIQTTAPQNTDKAELAATANLIAHIGVLMLRNGAASFRTKETLQRVADSLRVQQLDAFVTPTAIIVTVHHGYDTYTTTEKVRTLGVNMAKISALQAISHEPDKNGLTSIAELTQLVNSIESLPPVYPPFVVVIAVGLACGAFAFILGGGPLEFAAAAIAAATAQVLRFRLGSIRTNPYLITAICAAVATALSTFLIHLVPSSAPQLATISSVLLLVPGVPLITSLIDLIHLDLISGVTRGVYAALLLVNIGVGMLIVLTLTGATIL